MELPLYRPLLSKHLKKLPIPIKYFDTVFIPVWNYKIFVMFNTVIGTGKDTFSANFTEKLTTRRKYLD